MRNSTLLICLLLSLTACEQASEPKEQQSTPSNKTLAVQNTTTEAIRDEDRYPLFFIEVAKNLNISTQEFAQAMTRAGDNNASMENVAKELGVSLDDLQAALPKRPARKITFEPATGVEVVEPTESQADNKTAE